MKTGRLTSILYLWLHLFILITCMGCFKNIPIKKVVYETDFKDYKRPDIEIYNIFGKIDSPMVIVFNGTTLLGRFNNNLVTLSVDLLPEHNAIHIQFDLYIHDKWEGSHLDPITKIPDVWQLKIDQVPIMIRTFSNTTYLQSFPDDYNPILTQNPPHSDAWALLPGVCALSDKSDGTSLYKIDYITSHTGQKISLAMNDALQPFGQPCNKSWSIGNILITAVKYQ